MFDIDAFKNDMAALREKERELRRHILKKFEFDPRIPSQKNKSFKKSADHGWRRNARVDLDLVNKSESHAAAFNVQKRLDRLIATWVSGLKRVYAAQNRSRVKTAAAQANSPLRHKGTHKSREQDDQFRRGLRYLNSFAALPLEKARRGFTMEDVARAALAGQAWRRKVRALVARYDEFREFIRQFSAVEAQLRTRNGMAPIYCRFVRSINRRYQPVDMWPTYVGDWNLLKGPKPDKSDTYRNRWFQVRSPSGRPCRLVGLGISSSQSQIVAALFASKHLEDLTMDSGGPKLAFKSTTTAPDGRGSTPGNSWSSCNKNLRM